MKVLILKMNQVQLFWNKDGSISRIKNWTQLTKIEQDKLKMKIIKRNEKRRQTLLQKESKLNEQIPNE